MLLLLTRTFMYATLLFGATSDGKTVHHSVVDLFVVRQNFKLFMIEFVVVTLLIHLSFHFFSYMMIKGFPCKVLSISVSKTGKHGHAKCNFTAVDIFTGKKLEDMIPSTHGTTVPIVNKSEWEIIDIEGEELTLMDEGGNQKTDLNLPTYPEGLATEIRDAWSGGENSVVVTVQAAVGIEQVISFKKT